VSEYLTVEPNFQLIVGQQVTQDANDKQQLKPMVEVIEEQSGQKPEEVVSDSGYCSDANLGYLEKKQIEGFVAVDRESYRDREKPCPRGPLPEGATRVDRMRRKLQTKTGAAMASPSTWYRLVPSPPPRAPSEATARPAHDSSGTRCGTSTRPSSACSTGLAPIPCRHRQLLTSHFGVAGCRYVCAGEQCGGAG